MDIIPTIIERAAKQGIDNNPPEDGDYYDKEGILICGKCKTPKQKIIEAFGRKMLVVKDCKCKEEAKAKQEAEKKRREEFERFNAKVNELKRSSLIDEKFADCTFDQITVTKHNERQVKLCKRYAEKFDELFEKNQGLLLYGSIGTGKTYIASCICNELMYKLHPVYATSFVKLLEGKNSIDLETIIDRMDKAQLVLFDDLGAERKTDYAQEVVYNLIDSRYRQRKPMIVTTNLTLAEMQKATDEKYARIYDRILECCYPIGFDGPSFRIMEAAKRYDEIGKMLGG